MGRARHRVGNGWFMLPGELLALMLECDLFADEHDERRAEQRPAEPPPRKAIISHGQDVEECEVPVTYEKRLAA